MRYFAPPAVLLLLNLLFQLPAGAEEVRFSRQGRLFEKIRSRRTGENPGRKNHPGMMIFERFLQLDADSDRVLSPEELSRIQNPQAKEKLMAADSDKNGILTYAELCDRFCAALYRITGRINTALAASIKNTAEKGVTLADLAQQLSWLKSADFLKKFDLNSDGFVDAGESSKMLPQLGAMVFARRVGELAKLVNVAPETVSDDRDRFTARLIDYNADGQTSEEEFAAFLNKALGSEIAGSFLQHSESLHRPEASVKQNLPAPADVSQSERVSQSPQAIPLSAEKVLSKIEKQVSPEPPKTPAVFIVPAATELAGEIKIEADPLREMLGEGAEENLLW